jgi:PAS domain S-box-containing protein
VPDVPTPAGCEWVERPYREKTKGYNPVNNEKKRILLVEDEVFIAMLEKQQLEDIGYTVSLASNGEDAVKQAGSIDLSFDIILMDIDLGRGMDGTQAADEILREKDIPIVFLSSHTEPEIVEKTEKITSYGYAVKNSGISILDASIKMALKLYAEKMERKQAEKQSLQMKRLYAALSQVNQTIVRVGTLEELAGEVSRVVVLFGEFKLAWLGRHDAKTLGITPLGFAGEPEGFVRDYRHTSDELSGHKCLCGSAIRENRSSIVNNLSAGQEFSEWGAAMESVGIRSAAVFPVRVKGEVWGVFGVYAGDPDFFQDKDAALLEEAAMDIGFAIEHIGNEKKRQQAEKFQLLSTAVLGILNNPLTLREASGAILNLIKKEIGFDAVGIRLKDGDDFPYFSEDGFEEEFLLAENSVVLRNEIGAVCRDDDGRICLECTCGMVLAGKCGPPGDNVTKAGSIWTNDSLSMLEALHGNDPRLKPRDRCVHEGFLSVALIPIRRDNQIIGLLHLNDRRKDRFTPETIRFFEELTATFAIAVERKKAESALRENEAKFKAVFENAPVGISLLDSDRRLLESNDMLEKILRMNKEGLASGTYGSRKYIREDGTELPVSEMASTRAISERTIIRNVVTGIILEDGETIWTQVSAAPLGLPDTRFVVITEDITSLKRAEKEIIRQLSEKDTLLKEVHHRIKNNVSSIESFLLLQAHSSDNPVVKTALLESAARIQSIRVLYDNLLLSNDDLNVFIKRYLVSLIDSIVAVFPESGNVSVETEIADFNISSTKAIPVGIIINELITNILKYAFTGKDTGGIFIQLVREENLVTLMIRDNGIGIGENFDIRRSSKFGLTIVRMLAEQLRGTYTVENDHGTRIVLKFEI